MMARRVMLACALGLAACSGEVEEAAVDGGEAVNSAGEMVDESRAEDLQESADEALSEQRLEAAPDPQGREIDLLKPATPVSICEREGEWLGIVFAGAGQMLSACETSANMAQAKDYEGPCRSGWIERRMVEMAGG